MGAPTKALQNFTFLYPTGKDAIIKYLKLETPICFNSPITKHWTPSTKNLIFFVTLEVLSGGLQMFFQLQKQRNHVWVFDLFEFFSFQSLAYLPYLVQMFLSIWSRS